MFCWVRPFIRPKRVNRLSCGRKSPVQGLSDWAMPAILRPLVGRLSLLARQLRVSGPQRLSDQPGRRARTASSWQQHGATSSGIIAHMHVRL
jgi:hypothetical protein